MDDNDYIRKAVELADGWGFDGIWLCYGDAGAKIHDGEHAFDKPMPNYLKDALAAQLVRQMDALDKFGVMQWATGDVDVMEYTATDNPLEREHILASRSAPDRAMNTIKAIVDSKVLGID